MTFGIGGNLFLDVPICGKNIFRKQNSVCFWRQAYNKYRCDYVYGASLNCAIDTSAHRTFLILLSLDVHFWKLFWWL